LRAVILAAGKGTRLGEMTDAVPKPMLEVGGRPMLWHVLHALRVAGVSEAALIVGYRADVIRDHFGAGEDVGMRLVYFVQETQNGTGKAAEPAREFLSDGPFFFSFGDIMTDPAVYSSMAADFEARPADLLLAVRQVPDPSRFGAVRTEGGRIVEIVEKPAPGEEPSNWVNAGVFIARPVLFDYTARLEKSPRGEYEIPDALRMMIADGRVVRAYELQSDWRDIGTPEDLAAASAEGERESGLQ